MSAFGGLAFPKVGKLCFYYQSLDGALLPQNLAGKRWGSPPMHLFFGGGYPAPASG
jgi:hypothetical protein